MASAAAPKRKLDKIRAKLNKMLDEKDFYSAQQLYKTLYSRYHGRRQPDAAFALVQEGSSKLLELQQSHAGGELSLLVVDSLVKTSEKPSADHIALLLDISSKFPASPAEPHIAFLKAAIKWSKANSESEEHEDGEAKLHLQLARAYRGAKDYGNAQRHYLRGENFGEHAEFLVEWSQTGFVSERTLFSARTVLQYLCLENMAGANAVHAAYGKAYARESESLDTPLNNFIRFLLKTVERDAAPLFMVLQNKYSTALSRDPSFGKYLSKVGEIYFGIQPPKSMFGDLMKDLGL